MAELASCLLSQEASKGWSRPLQIEASPPTGYSWNSAAADQEALPSAGQSRLLQVPFGDKTVNLVLTAEHIDQVCPTRDLTEVLLELVFERALLCKLWHSIVQAFRHWQS